MQPKIIAVVPSAGREFKWGAVVDVYEFVVVSIGVDVAAFDPVVFTKIGAKVHGWPAIQNMSNSESLTERFQI